MTHVLHSGQMRVRPWTLSEMHHFQVVGGGRHLPLTKLSGPGNVGKYLYGLTLIE